MRRSPGENGTPGLGTGQSLNSATAGRFASGVDPSCSGFRPTIAAIPERCRHPRERRRLLPGDGRRCLGRPQGCRSPIARGGFEALPDRKAPPVGRARSAALRRRRVHGCRHRPQRPLDAPLARLRSCATPLDGSHSVASRPECPTLPEVGHPWTRPSQMPNETLTRLPAESQSGHLRLEGRREGHSPPPVPPGRSPCRRVHPTRGPR